MGNEIEKDWTTGAGLRAVVLKANGRHRCGYVCVPVGHPLFGVRYDQETPLLATAAASANEAPIGSRGVVPVFLAAMGGGSKPTPEHVFDVHGSLTYSGGAGKYPAEGEGWWFGFDCAHSGDDFEFGRPLEYVVDNCEKLAQQLCDVLPSDMRHPALFVP